MNSKKLLRQILVDIYKNLDEYSKDLIMAENLEVEFKGLNIQSLDGKRHFIKNLHDSEELSSFESVVRKYHLRKVNLKNSDDGLIIIHLTSRKANTYSFELDNAFEVVKKTYANVSFEHRDRIIQWNELEDEQLDKELSRFDVNSEKIVNEVIENTKINEVLVYIDVFMDLEKIENFIEREDGKIILWIHPTFLFSKEPVLIGLIAYELSRYDYVLLERNYQNILEYCKEYRELCNKNLKIIEKIREIAVKRNDSDVIKEIDRLTMI
ncbi:conserved hypothetical protein [Methanococcus vannielii SB]|jgi:hypothetical protein|uniref:Uncharacterized protein n=1 Tax=Methanococcus vannielii (strain ATCC 35089 / DSM 1224 / JCM 13029 / OCM 148 / SB) TaxID=406327 RepID=A6URI2_METVS|nr:hypothetical protein [Methanococcus vannielii]ABR55104.1 conserved hypothetical protein [Methanococcus vannielii SB]